MSKIMIDKHERRLLATEAVAKMFGEEVYRQCRVMCSVVHWSEFVVGYTKDEIYELIEEVEKEMECSEYWN